MEGVHKKLYGGCVGRAYTEYCMEGVHRNCRKGVHKILYGGRTQNIVWRVYTIRCTQNIVQRVYTIRCTQNIV